MPVTITNTTIQKARQDAVPGCQRYDVLDAKARGLELRVGPRGCRWNLRYQLHGKYRRLLLGDVDYWTLTEVRELVNDAQRLIRSRITIPDEEWLDRYKLRTGKERPPESPDTPPPRLLFKWTVAEGLKRYLEWLQSARSKATYDDYRLKLKALQPIEKRPVATITRIDMAGVIADIHRAGKEAQAEGTARAVSAFWSWLAEDTQIAKSGVEPGAMRGLKAPERRRRPSRRMVADPTLEDLPRIVAICRSGALEPIIACAIELTVYSLQRRRAVTSAHVEDFRPILNGDEGLWYVYSDDRKRSDGEAHVIPLPAPAWACVQRAIAAGKGSEFLFPAFRERRKGQGAGHLHGSTVTHTMSWLPGVHSSPHDVRSVFGTFGERVLGFARPLTRLILDHAEGGMRSDITGRHYALHDGTHDKWPIMRKWSAAIEPEIAEAAATLPSVAEIKAAIAMARYRADEQREAAE